LYILSLPDALPISAIVKMDDVGLALTTRESERTQRTGRWLVRAMPVLLQTLSTVGIAAMLWVGGHILLVGADELGWHWPYAVVHDLEEVVHAAPASAVLEWLVNTAASAVVGLGVGLAVNAVVSRVRSLRGANNHGGEAGEA
jgi:hypothetical protein